MLRVRIIGRVRACRHWKSNWRRLWVWFSLDLKRVIKSIHRIWVPKREKLVSGWIRVPSRSGIRWRLFGIGFRNCRIRRRLWFSRKKRVIPPKIVYLEWEIFVKNNRWVKIWNPLYDLIALSDIIYSDHSFI